MKKKQELGFIGHNSNLGFFMTGDYERAVTTSAYNPRPVNRRSRRAADKLNRILFRKNGQNHPNTKLIKKQKARSRRKFGLITRLFNRLRRA